MSEWKLGDTVRVRQTSVYALGKEDELLQAVINDEFPEFMKDNYVDVVLTTKQMLDEYNTLVPHDPR